VASALAAISSSLSVTFTPTLMLGAITIAMSRAASAIWCFWASLKPVVPITRLTPRSRQADRCASVPFGSGEVDQHVGIGEAGREVRP
jgi:hypothetical protein